MTKQEFVDQVADRAGSRKRDAGEAVDAFLDVDHRRPEAAATVTFTGFGKFSTQQRAAARASTRATEREGHDPGGDVPKFSAGSSSSRP